MYVTQSYHWDGSSRLQICYITAGNSQALTAIDQAEQSIIQEHVYALNVEHLKERISNFSKEEGNLEI